MRDPAAKALPHPGTTYLLYPGEPHPADCEKCDCQHFRYGSGGGMMQGDPPEQCRCGHYTFWHRFRPFDPEDARCQTVDGRS